MKKSDIFKLILWEGVNQSLLKRKKNKVYDFPVDFHGINIGCGLHNPPKWKGIDGGATHYIAKKLPGPVFKLFYKGFNMHKNYTLQEYKDKVKNLDLVHHDLLFGLPYKSETIPNVYSSHFFEHLFKEQAIDLLKECYRVLKKGGCIRICVPSLDHEVEKIAHALEAYRAGDIAPIEKYVTWNNVGYSSYYSNHHWMYNPEELKSILQLAGFTDIKECAYHQGSMIDVDVLDNRNGIYFEGFKK
jgi:predicted SAM-dependent methyltransferase